MKKTGELLKQKRESAKLSISEVALATKINPKILTAIESGDESHLPAKTFLKGFVRSYAVFLKCDVEVVMNLFMEETGGAPGPRPAASEPPRAAEGGTSSLRRVDEEGSSGLRTAAVVGIVILIGLIIGVRELIEKYQREKIVTNEVKVTPLATPPVVPNPAPVEKPAGEEAKPAAMTTAAAPVPPPSPAPASAPAATSTPAQVSTPPPVLPPPQAPPPQPPAQPPKPVVQTPPATPAPPTPAKPAPSKVKAGKVEIILEALDKVEIKFNVHGEPRKLSLGPTQVHTIHSDEPIVLDVSDAGAVNVIVNGRDRGTLGELGKSAQVKIP